MRLRVDRSKLSDAEGALLDVKRELAMERREANRSAKVCVNENTKGEHGLATHGSRCLRCHLVRRLGKEAARQRYEYVHFEPVRPVAKPDYTDIISFRERMATRKAPAAITAAPKVNFCAVCTDEGPTVPVDLNGDGVLFQVCRDCNTGHPRTGRYGFSDGARSNRAGVDRAIGHRKAGAH